jgi:hypothetical protein
MGNEERFELVVVGGGVIGASVASPAAPPALQTTAGQPAATGEDGFIEQALAYLNAQAGRLFFDEEAGP